MKIVCVGLETDLVLARLLTQLKAAGASVTRVDPLGFGTGDPMFWDGEGFVWFDEDLSTLDAIIVRRLPAERALPPAGTTISAAEAERFGSEAMERAHFFEAWLWDAEQRGVPIYNPSVSRQFDHKPLQLAMLQRAGVPLPRTMITNSGTAAGLFADDVGEVIYKPVGGGRETELLTAEARARLTRLGSAPVIFQERIVGPDYRLTVIGGEVVSQVEIPSHPVDYRLGEAYRAGQQTYLEVSLPAEIQALAVRVADLCHHAVSGIDVKRGADGRFVVLEANSAPVYLDIELKVGHAITARWVELVLRKSLRF